MTALADGGWLVTWTSYGQDGSGFGIYQQRYNSEGGTVGGETWSRPKLPCQPQADGPHRCLHRQQDD